MKKKTTIIGAGVAMVIIIAIAFIALSYINYGKYRTTLINNDFSLKKVGWTGSLGEIRKDSSGNRYAVNDYNWGLYQIVSIIPGSSYSISADTKKGTSKTAARLVVVFYNNREDTMPVCYNINYWHKGDEWESIPSQTVNAPENTNKARVYILASSGTGNHFFDNIRLEKHKTKLPSAPFEVNINKPQKTQATEEEENVAPDESPKQSASPAMVNPLGTLENENVITYIVKPGNTLERIAGKFNYDLDTLIKTNQIKNPSLIFPGQKLFIPVQPETTQTNE